jgi:hypothetical protein
MSPPAPGSLAPLALAGARSLAAAAAFLIPDLIGQASIPTGLLALVALSRLFAVAELVAALPALAGAAFAFTVVRFAAPRPYAAPSREIPV